MEDKDYILNIKYIKFKINKFSVIFYLYSFKIK